MRRNRLRILAVILALCMSMLCSPVALATTDINDFHVVPYAQTGTLQIGQRVFITGTPNYSAATSNDTTNLFGFDTSEGVWYISIGKTSVAAFQAAMPAQQVTLYGMYAGTMENGMPILDIQQGAVRCNSELLEAPDLSAAGQKIVDEAAAKAAEEKAAAEREAQKQVAAAQQSEKSSVKSNSQMVWIPRTGHKYHSNPYCSNMKNPSKVDVQTAKSMGYSPCKKCY